MKKSVKIILISAIVLLIIYAVQCIYISFKIKKIIDESYTTYGRVNKFPDDISDLNFLRMCFRDEYDKDRITYEKYSYSFPITLVFFNKAKSWYWWEYYSDYACGIADIPDTVDLELKNFRWCVTDVHCNP